MKCCSAKRRLSTLHTAPPHHACVLAKSEARNLAHIWQTSKQRPMRSSNLAYRMDEVQDVSGPFSRGDVEKILCGPFRSSPFIAVTQTQPNIPFERHMRPTSSRCGHHQNFCCVPTPALPGRVRRVVLHARIRAFSGRVLSFRRVVLKSRGFALSSIPSLVDSRPVCPSSLAASRRRAHQYAFLHTFFSTLDHRRLPRTCASSGGGAAILM